MPLYGQSSSGDSSLTSGWAEDSLAQNPQKNINGT